MLARWVFLFIVAAVPAFADGGPTQPINPDNLLTSDEAAIVDLIRTDFCAANSDPRKVDPAQVPKDLEGLLGKKLSDISVHTYNKKETNRPFALKIVVSGAGPQRIGMSFRDRAFSIAMETSGKKATFWMRGKACGDSNYYARATQGDQKALETLTFSELGALSQPVQKAPAHRGIGTIAKSLGSSVAHAGIWAKMTNPFVAAYDLVRFDQEDHFAKAYFRLSDSALNPLGLADALVSDAVRVGSAPFDRDHPHSSRVRICTASLSGAINSPILGGALAPVMPAEHVGILLDGNERFTDPGGGGLTTAMDRGGLRCVDAPILSTEPEPAILERVSCVANTLTSLQEYSFFSYNCGGFTRDVLELSGLGAPVFANLGVGSGFPVRRDPPDRAMNLGDVRDRCDHHMAEVSQALSELRAGMKIDAGAVYHLQHYPWLLYPDTYLALLAEATHTKNPDIRAQALSLLSQDVGSDLAGTFFDWRTSRVPDDVRTAAQSIAKDLDSEDLAWIQANFADAYAILVQVAPGP